MDTSVDHNTALQISDFYNVNIQVSASYSGFVFTNNIVFNGPNGLNGNTKATLDMYFPGYVFMKNVLVGGQVDQNGNCSSITYPPGNFCPATWDEVQFVDQANGNYRLGNTSQHRSAGTDGKDIGADIDAIDAATANVVQPP